MLVPSSSPHLALFLSDVLLRLHSLLHLPLDILSHKLEVSSCILNPLKCLILSIEYIINNHLGAIFECHFDPCFLFLRLSSLYQI
jgi:hypothetical protein